ncbi:MAG: orotidine-5'-phosphate decarboxylase [Thermoanaerobaculia bacterium]
MKGSERLIVALDRATREDVIALVDRLHGVAGVFKIGLQAFVANGPDLVREITGRGEKVFLDLKLHDIPHTVARAVEALGPLGVSMVTVHASGGRAMLRAAADAAQGGPLVLGVTVLTSLGEGDLDEVGLAGGTGASVERLARLAAAAGLGGVVASPREIGMIRAAAPSLRIVTPGIRAAGDAGGDQARTLSAAEAVAAGADCIVVGRPITDAPDPRAAAEAILATLS